jgi:hypothetical protein
MDVSRVEIDASGKIIIAKDVAEVSHSALDECRAKNMRVQLKGINRGVKRLACCRVCRVVHVLIEGMCPRPTIGRNARWASASSVTQTTAIPDTSASVLPSGPADPPGCLVGLELALHGVSFRRGCRESWPIFERALGKTRKAGAGGE